MNEKFEQDLLAIKQAKGRDAKKQALISFLSEMCLDYNEIESFNEAFDIDDRENIELLFEVMSHEQGDTPSNAAFILGERQEPSVMSKLVEIITSIVPSTQLRIHACHALRGHWRHLKATDALIAIAQDDEELEVRIAALSALYHHANNGVPEAAKRILKLCSDPKAKIRHEIVEHCSEEEVPRLLKDHIKDFLIAESTNDNPGTRYHAIHALVTNRFEGPDVITAILKRIDDEVTISETAFYGLRRLDGPFLVDSLLETAKRQAAKAKKHAESVDLPGLLREGIAWVLSLEKELIGILNLCGSEHLEAALQESIIIKDWYKCRLLSTALQQQSEND